MMSLSLLAGSTVGIIDERSLQSLYNHTQAIVTVVPAKSDSDIMLCLQRYQGLIADR